LNGQQLIIVMHFCALAISPILTTSARQPDHPSSLRFLLQAEKYLDKLAT